MPDSPPLAGIRGAIQTYDQVFTDPQLQARGYIWKAPHPVLGLVEQLG
jgi:crotonobetainyl-CoA:carnitine CoA-transferase CaiB-like acyl-CoA transferase